MRTSSYFRSRMSAGLALLPLAAACASAPSPEEPPQSATPNIVLILADDLGYGDIRAYNPESRIPTPHLDRLAAQGISFTDAHSPSAVCTPTRYGLLTGRYAWRTRLKQGVLWGYSPALIEPGRLTLPEMLRRQGYVTAGIGKWHLGLGDRDSTDYTLPLRPGPATQGFDHFYGIPASLDMDPYLWVENERAVGALTEMVAASTRVRDGGLGFWRAGRAAPGFRHVDVLPVIGERSVEFIRRHPDRGGKPFFLYVPLSGPHTPWLPLPEFAGRSGAGPYGDFVAQVDDLVGRVLAELERQDVVDETIVVFTSDNGASWREEEIAKFGHRANGRLRGQKADIWEGGHRVPFIVRWPGRVAPGSTSDQLLGLNDLFATFASALDIPLPADAAEDSYDLLPALLGTARAPIREHLIHHSSRGVFAIRQGRWKLIPGELGSGGFSPPQEVEPQPGGPQGQLYDLAADPAETRNLWQERPDVVARLTGLLERYRRQGFSREF